MDVRPPIGTRIRMARAVYDYSQRELAEKLGVERQWVIRREDHTTKTKLKDWQAIANICGVPPEWFTVSDLMKALQAGSTSTSSETRTAAAQEALAEGQRLAEEAIPQRAERKRSTGTSRRAQGGQGSQP